MVLKNLCVLVLWTKVALALEGLSYNTITNNHHRQLYNRNYLKEKCLSEYYKQLSFKYFVKYISISKYIVKNPDYNFKKKN